MFRVGRSVVAAVTAATCAGLVAACGSGSSASTAAGVTGTTRLPLQSAAPVIGGDVQPKIVDAVRVGLTDKQAKDITAHCAGAQEITNVNGSCATLLPVLMTLPPCKPSSLCIELGQATGTDIWLVRIVDERPERPLCGSGPEGLCWQLPVGGPALARLGVAVASASASGGSASVSASASPSASAASVGPSESLSRGPSATASASASAMASPTPSP